MNEDDDERLVVRAQAAPAGCFSLMGIPVVRGLAAVVACVAMSVALLASWIPARRAADVDPLVALRAE